MMKKTKPFQIRFPEEILERLKAVADDQHTTSSEIVRRLVIDYLKKVENKDASSGVPDSSNAPSTEIASTETKKLQMADVPTVRLPEDNPPIDEPEIPF